MEQVIQYNQLMLTLSVQDIVLLILLIPLALAQGGYISSFPEFIETGSLYLNPTVNGTNSGNEYALNVNLTFKTNKNTSSYEQTLSIEELQLKFLDNGLSLRLIVPHQSDSYMEIYIGGNCSQKLLRLRIRYLIVLPELRDDIQIIHINRNYSTPQEIKSSPPLNITIEDTSFLAIANETKASVILKGFTVYNNQSDRTDIKVASKLLDNNITIIITSDHSGQKILVSQISLTVILIKKSFTINNLAGSFQVSVQDNYNSHSIDHHNSSTSYSEATTFLGIRSFNVLNNYGLSFNFSINSYSVTFYQYDNSSKNNQYAVSIINFVFNCGSPTRFFLPWNNSCQASCPNSTFQSSTNTFLCQQCSGNCSTCFGSVGNCTGCQDGYYLNSGACDPCNTSIKCSTCQSLIECNTCIPGYIKDNHLCVLNCSSLDNCNLCSLSNSNIQCQNCSQGYVAKAGTCQTVCGDGFTFANEKCDDGNLTNGDGCSQNCTIQQYYDCPVLGNKSVCNLAQIKLQYLYATKEENANSFLAYFNVLPDLAVVKSLSWSKGISFASLNCIVIGSHFDLSLNKLVVEGSYSEDLADLQVVLQVQFLSMSPITRTLPTQNLSQSIVAQNNLSLKNYSSSTYAFAAIIKYFCIFLSCVSLIMFLIGFIGGKLIILEHLAVFQIISLSMVTVHEASPTFSSMRYLRYSLGSTLFSQYDYSINLGRQFKGAIYNVDPLLTFNVGLVFVFLPILAAGLLKLLSIRCKDSKLLPRIWPIILGQNTYYVLIFSSYIILSQLFFQLSIMKDGNIDAYIGLVFSICLSLLILAYSFFLHRYQMHFGDFKKKFQKFNICTYFYSFIVLERLLSSLLVILLKGTTFGLGVVILVIGAQFLFVAIRKPYNCGDYRRPLINLATTIVALTAVLCNSILTSFQALQLFAPFLICILLTITLFCNSFYFIRELREVFAEDNLKFGNLKKGLVEKVFKLEEEESIQQKNNIQFEYFKKKLRDEGEEQNLMNSPKIPVDQTYLNDKKELNRQWEYYTVLSKNQVLQQMRVKIRSKMIKDNKVNQ